MRLVWAALSVGVLLFAGCSEQEEPPKVRLWALAPPEITQVDGDGVAPLRFAVALTISPQEGYRLYGDLSEVLGQKIGHPHHEASRFSQNAQETVVKRNSSVVQYNAGVIALTLAQGVRRPF